LVLTGAASAGRVDSLRGLKEDVIVGRLIPTGTGMPYRDICPERDASPAQPSLERARRKAAALTHWPSLGLPGIRCALSATSTASSDNMSRLTTSTLDATGRRHQSPILTPPCFAGR
jgi:hypothetical protein